VITLKFQSETVGESIGPPHFLNRQAAARPFPFVSGGMNPRLNGAS
jgi:hypothetical protein